MIYPARSDLSTRCAVPVSRTETALRLTLGTSTRRSQGQRRRLQERPVCAVAECCWRAVLAGEQRLSVSVFWSGLRAPLDDMA
jgi:hypothetical protein